MKGFVGLTAKEKEDILKKHSQPYDGYATRGISGNMYPLTVYNDVKDTGGITLNNQNIPSTYRNHRINEIAAKNLHYDEIDPAYEFDSKGPGDPNLGYNVYNQTKKAYDFDSQGPADPYYGGGYQTGFEEHGEDSDDNYKFDMVDFEKYIRQISNDDQVVEHTIKTLKMFNEMENKKSWRLLK